jgi:hypothetical protein
MHRKRRTLHDQISLHPEAIRAGDSPAQVLVEADVSAFIAFKPSSGLQLCRETVFLTFRDGAFHAVGRIWFPSAQPI